MQHCLGREGLTVKDNTLVSLALQIKKGLEQDCYLSIQRACTGCSLPLFPGMHSISLAWVVRLQASRCSYLVLSLNIYCKQLALSVKSMSSQAIHMLTRHVQCVDENPLCVRYGRFEAALCTAVSGPRRWSNSP